MQRRAALTKSGLRGIPALSDEEAQRRSSHTTNNFANAVQRSTTGACNGDRQL
jgi:hypothetical protein